MTTPIISSLLDTDLYKLTMGAVVFHNFPNAKVKYIFINRNKTPFPDDFHRYLRTMIHELSWMRLSTQEFEWLKSLPFIRPTYAEWLRGYSFDPNELTITQNGGELTIEIEGPWYRTILWEVPLMAMISELYFRMTGYAPAPDWKDRITVKAQRLSEAGCLWSDFGTRRRFSKQVQAEVVRIMSQFKGFIGTSNPQLAMLNKVNPIGTSAHEAVMAMSAYTDPVNANTTWLNYWWDYYHGKLSIALTDTYTTDVFLQHFPRKYAQEWEGLRQDSGDPFEWANKKVIPHYKALGVDLHDKKLVFSDNLNVDKAIALNDAYRGVAIPVFGIGTHLSNDVFTAEEKAKGARPLNMVIKLKAVDFGSGWRGVVKLSDDHGKYTGTTEDIQNVLDKINEQPPL